jgi:hypothetical protein
VWTTSAPATTPSLARLRLSSRRQAGESPPLPPYPESLRIRVGSSQTDRALTTDSLRQGQTASPEGRNKTSIASRKFVPYVCVGILLYSALKTRHFSDSACKDSYSANLRDGILAQRGSAGYRLFSEPESLQGQRVLPAHHSLLHPCGLGLQSSANRKSAT